MIKSVVQIITAEHSGGRMQYYDQNGKKIGLGEKIGQGGEATVYEVAENPQSVAKIYHDLQKTPVEKLRLMLKNPPVDPSMGLNHVSIVWVSALICNEQKAVCGYIMPKIGGTQIFKFYNPSIRMQEFPGFTWNYLHRSARNLASAVEAIHEKGYVIGDLNESNVLVHSNTLITIIDTDSFQVIGGKNQIFRCPVGKDEYMAPEIQGARLSEIIRNRHQDNFALAVIIFRLLMEGFHPLQGSGEPAELSERIKRGLFPYLRTKKIGAEPPRNGPPFTGLHYELQRLFFRCFTNGHKKPEIRPSAGEWRKALKTAEDSLIKCRKNEFHYYSDEQKKCIWCERKNLLQGLDTFPDLNDPKSAQEALPPFPGSKKGFPVGMTLHKVVEKYTEPEIVLEFIRKNQPDMNERNNYDSSPLMRAAALNQNPEIISILVKNGASINDKNKKGRTPLMFAAAFNSNPKIVKALIKLGADLRETDESGMTARQIAREMNTNPQVAKGFGYGFLANAIRPILWFKDKIKALFIRA
jgi:serine/threonine protein kinase